jgi:hypothetical protein
MARTPDVDVLAVQHDGALINALAVRGDLDVFGDDPVAGLLVAWVESIDAGIDDGRSWVVPEQERTPVTPVRPHRRGRAGLVAGATVAVLVVSSGAAAAVTGDALAIVRAPIDVLGRVSPFAAGQDDAKSELPEPAAPVAGPNKLLADAQRALAQGDTEEAARLLAQAQGLLGDVANPGQQHRIDKLTAQLGADHQGRGKGSDQDKGKGTDQDKGKGTDQDNGKDSDQDKGKDANQDKGKDTDQGTGTTQEPGTSAPGNQGKHSTRAHGSEKPEQSSDANKVKSGNGTAKGTGQGMSGGQRT